MRVRVHLCEKIGRLENELVASCYGVLQLWSVVSAEWCEHKIQGHDVGSRRGRNITTDNFFTSDRLAQELIQRRLSLVGTVCSNRKKSMQLDRSRPACNSVFGYSSDGVTMVSYVTKPRKAVILLSRQHRDAAVMGDDNRKPDIITTRRKWAWTFGINQCTNTQIQQQVQQMGVSSSCYWYMWQWRIGVRHLILLRKIQFYKRILYKNDCVLHKLFCAMMSRDNVW